MKKGTHEVKDRSFSIHVCGTSRRGANAAIRVIIGACIRVSSSITQPKHFHIFRTVS